MLIKRADLDSPAFIALLEEHRAAMEATAPSESQHALDLAGLRQPDVCVWTLHEGDALLGCGALQRLDDEHAEIKSMRTARAHLRKGVARTILQHLLAESRLAGFQRVSLETGSMAFFEPARRLRGRARLVQRRGPEQHLHDARNPGSSCRRTRGGREPPMKSRGQSRASRGSPGKSTPSPVFTFRFAPR